MNELAKAAAKNILKDDPEIEGKIRMGIENNRQGYWEIALFDATGKPLEGAEIQIRLARHEYNFGCNIFMLDQFKSQEQNNLYVDAFRDLFNLAVAPFYWSDLEPKDGEVRFGKDSRPIYRRPPPDSVIEFCLNNKIVPKGHPLFWDHYYPSWLPKDKKSLATRIERRFREIGERYAGKVKIWDVINEVLAWNPLRCLMPDRHVELCFKLAEKYYPQCDLLYNDVSSVSWRNYRGDYTPLFQFVRRLQSLGCKVDGLGLQYHQFCNDDQLPQLANDMLNPQYLYACMDQYARLGIPLNVSEITVVGGKNLGDGEEFQALVTEKLYRIWFSHPATNGIIWWNLVDGTANDAPQGSDEGENIYKAGLVKYDFSRKKAYNALKHLIKKEWTTDLKMDYRAGKLNKFQGFYGTYDLTIKTDRGSFERSLVLHKGSLNTVNLVLSSESAK